MKRVIGLIGLICLVCNGVMGQTQLKGRVCDEKGEPVIGASIVVKGTTNGTATDLDGNFILKAKVGQTIQITYIGYKSYESILTADKIKTGMIYYLYKNKNGTETSMSNTYTSSQKFDKGYEAWKKEDFTQAFKWFKESATEGNAQAQNWLGSCYLNGKGVEKDESKAFAWYNSSATLGSANGMANLGYCYYTGRGVTKDYKQAVSWLEKAIAKGSDNAKFYLAWCYELGRGVPMDLDKAIALYREAKAAGLNVEKEFSEALYKKMVASTSQTKAQEQASSLTASQKFNKGYEAWKKKDFTQAFKWFKESAVEGNAQAQNWLGECYLKGEGVEKNETQAFTWYKSSATLGSAGGMSNLGYCYYSGHGVAKDYKQAVSWLEKAIAKGNNNAKVYLGWCYEFGLGVTQNIDKAITLYKEAQNEGIDVGKYLSRAIAMQQKNEREKNIMIPPVVTIIPPAEYPNFSDTKLEIQYHIETAPNNPIKEVKVTVNGEIQPQARVVSKGRSVTVILPKHDSSISITACNQSGWSEPKFLNLKWDSSKEMIIRPNLYVLAIGINNYDNITPPLKFAVKDMTDFIHAVQTKKMSPYEEIFVTKLSDKQATRQKIEDELVRLSQKAEDTDFTFIYFSGHGLKYKEKSFYLAPVDANKELIPSTCIDADKFSKYLGEIHGKVVVFIDACYSGSLLKYQKAVSTIDMQEIVSDMCRAKPGRYIYASSQDDAVSNELPEWGNGAFTKALIEAFNGKARVDNKKILSTFDLMDYLRKRMKEILRNSDQQQKPGFSNLNEEFPLFTY